MVPVTCLDSQEPRICWAHGEQRQRSGTKLIGAYSGGGEELTAEGRVAPLQALWSPKMHKLSAERSATGDEPCASGILAE